MAKNPFDDDDTQDAKAADKAAVESVKEKVAQRAADKPADDEPLEVDLDSAEEELTPEPVRESRSEKRQNRYRAAQEARTAAEKRAEEAERRESQTREMLLNIQRQMQQPQQPQQQKPDPLDEELNSVFKEQDLLFRDYNARAAQMTAAEHEEYANKVRALQRRLLVTGARLGMREEGINRQPDPRQLHAMMVAQRLKDDHDDLMSDQQRQMHFDGVWRQLRAEGKPDNWNTINEAAEISRRRFGLPSKNKQAPSDSYKRKLSGATRGGGAGAGDSPRVVTMNKQHRAMADASYRHIKDPTERYKRWAAGPGKKLIERQG